MKFSGLTVVKRDRSEEEDIGKLNRWTEAGAEAGTEPTARIGEAGVKENEKCFYL